MKVTVSVDVEPKELVELAGRCTNKNPEATADEIADKLTKLMDEAVANGKEQ